MNSSLIHNKHKIRTTMAKETIKSVEDQLSDAIFEVLKRNYSSNLTAAKLDEACSEVMTTCLRVVASMGELFGTSDVEVLIQVRNQIDANIDELKNGQSERQAFDMQVLDLRSCIDSALDRMKIHGIEAKDVLQRAAAKWFAHHVAMNYGQDENGQVLLGICDELKHQALSEFADLDLEIQSMGDALLEG